MRWGRPAALAVLMALQGCDLAPQYQPPAMLLPADYHGSGPFVVAAPQDAQARGPWWRIFNDPVLDGLERQVDADNPDLKAAAETYTQARDIVGEARAGLFPQITSQFGLSDNKQSEHRLFRTSSAGPNEEASNQVDASLAWQPDFWFSIRNQTRSAKAEAQMAAAQLASARLSLEADLATDYMELRGLDDEHAVYVQTIASYTTAVQITRMRLADLIASGLDEQRAENQLAAAEAADTAVMAQRAVLVHAIAVLAGVLPGTLELPPAAPDGMAQASPGVTQGDVPVVPAGIPSGLLQRRPDIAAAERQMAAANAQIGVARAAFYPNISISAISGFNDSGFNLISLPESMWAVGASAMLPLFEGGLRRAELQQSWSRFSQTTDTYRATVLTAFQQVEDGLVLTSLLATQARQEQASIAAALHVQNMSLTLYRGGLSDYLDVTVAQVAALTAEIAGVQVHTLRQQATVNLVAALGGGWSASDLPTMGQTLPFKP